MKATRERELFTLCALRVSWFFSSSFFFCSYLHSLMVGTCSIAVALDGDRRLPPASPCPECGIRWPPPPQHLPPTTLCSKRDVFPVVYFTRQLVGSLAVFDPKREGKKMPSFFRRVGNIPFLRDKVTRKRENYKGFETQNCSTIVKP